MNYIPFAGKSARITSLSFFNQPDERVWEAVEAAGRMKSDLIALPETWAGADAIDTLDSPRVLKLRELAKKYNTYIVSGMYRRIGSDGRINSAILIGRSGEIEGIYDKVYPFWEEFDHIPPVQYGKEALVFDTDFCRLGIAICFDANFPELWYKMADLGAELIIWPSAYSGGSSLQAQAVNNNFYIVTSTLASDCSVFDITGREILYNKINEYDDFLTSSIVLDFDRCIFHRDFNGVIKTLLKEHAGEVIQEQAMPKEGWFVLKSVKESVSAREVAKKYNMEELPAYKVRSRKEQDEARAKVYTDLRD